MNKKLKSLIVSGLVIASCIGSNSLNAYAATKKVSASGTVNAINFATNKPVAYLYAYNSKGAYVAKYPLSSTFQFGNKYKLSLGSTKIDDTKVSKVCLQLKSDYGTKYSSRVNLKSGAYSITLGSYGVPTIK